MSDDPTAIPTPAFARPRRRESDEAAPALAIAWSREEQPRAGEVALLPPGADVILGRGAGAAGGGRVAFLRQRPGEQVETPPLTAAGLSREQLRLRLAGDAIEVERVGKGELLVNHVVTDRATLRPGDTLVVRHLLVLVCVERPPSLPPLRHYPRAAMPPFGEPDRHGIAGESPAAWRLRERLAFCAGVAAPVLILGPSGTGKELCAAAIHGLSPRGPRPLVARNAATLPEGLIDAELFGNVRDYPNPGMRERPGLLGEAEGSTLFLDEIGEIGSELQAHLLRVLDGGDYHRLGEARARRADVRMVLATNRAAAELKHDLAARLTLRVEVPGLDERREDIALIARAGARRMAEGSPALARLLAEGEPRIHPDVIDCLLRLPYSHHARELMAFLWRAAEAGGGDHLALPPDAPEASGARRPGAEPTREEILASLERHGWNVSLAHADLGLSSRFALHRLMKKHGIERS